MKLSIQTLDALAQIITGNSEIAPYRTGRELVNFFHALELNNVPTGGYGSRQGYVEAMLFSLNNQPVIKEVIEAAVDVRNFLETDYEEQEVIDFLNKYLTFDGYHIVQDGNNNKVVEVRSYDNTSYKIKNLIFAANGPKPELVLQDALANDIEIVKNGEFCLVYDRDLGSNGLLWQDLVEWWAFQNSLEFPSDETEYNLYYRLAESLSSEPEKMLFYTYFNRLRREIDDALPALIPQVYLHYDPKTLKELQGKKRLKRQRMDFLLLMPNWIRIIIEIDGQQHYSQNGTPDPKKYAEMVSEDRKLRLAGYEVYRFGGYEFRGEKGRQIIEDFFRQLLKKHEVISKDIKL